MLLIIIILRRCSSVCQTCLSLLKIPCLKSKALQGTIAWEFYRVHIPEQTKAFLGNSYFVYMLQYICICTINTCIINDKQGSSVLVPLQVNRVPHIRENVEAAKYGKMEPSCHACNGHTPPSDYKLPAYVQELPQSFHVH